MNLVTGATGHIGNVLVRHLLARGQRVRALIMPGEDLTPLDGLAINVVTGDVLDKETLKSAFRGVQNVYHLAGMISILPGVNPHLEAVNIEGTRNVLEAAREANVQRLVYTSSIHALQRVPHGVMIDENIPFDPIGAISAYDHSKAAASLEVLQATKQGLAAVIVCPTGVIGPYDYRRSEIGRLIQDCLERKPQPFVDGAYDFVDVRDVALGLILACENGRVGETYILSGEQITVRSLLDSVRSITGRSFLRLRLPMSLARLAASFAPLIYKLTRIPPRFTSYSVKTLLSNSLISSAKAKQELGYSPRPLRFTIMDTVLWFLENQRLFAAHARS